ncbi:MAG: biotin--[acetyl-CoA-carboxylase] ligase [Actinomycetota bacterium]
MEKFDIGAYKKELRTKKLGKNIIYLNSIDSTNNYALSLQNKGSLKGSIILAEKQTRGRGRFESEWKSPPGGLWFTLILDAPTDSRNLPKVTILSAYAVAESLKKTLELEVNIKWPNDIYYKNRKLGGILAEAQDECINLGIGLNVNLDTGDLGQYSTKSTSIKKILGKDVSREKLLAQIINTAENIFQKFSSGNDFAYFFKKIEKVLIY